MLYIVNSQMTGRIRAALPYTTLIRFAVGVYSVYVVRLEYVLCTVSTVLTRHAGSAQESRSIARETASTCNRGTISLKPFIMNTHPIGEQLDETAFVEKIYAKVISGEVFGVKGPITARTPTYFIDFTINAGTKYSHVIPAGWNSLIVVHQGSLKI